MAGGDRTAAHCSDWTADWMADRRGGTPMDDETARREKQQTETKNKQTKKRKARDEPNDHNKNR